MVDFIVNSGSFIDDGDINNSVTTLGEAIDAANNTPGRDTISIALSINTVKVGGIVIAII